MRKPPAMSAPEAGTRARFASTPARDPRPKTLANTGQSISWTTAVTAATATRALGARGQGGREPLIVGIARASPAIARYVIWNPAENNARGCRMRTAQAERTVAWKTPESRSKSQPQ